MIGELTPPRPGDVLADRFEIGDTIGSGGHGHVLLATHKQLGYPVAVKLLDAAPDDRSEVRLERFRREAILGASVRSTNVARVLEAGETPAGQPFLIMELVDGPSLAEVLTSAPLSVAATVDLGLQLTAALAAFETHQVVHRDIKPSNIVLRREPDGRVVAKLVDLGISHVASTAPVDARITRANHVVGTPLYMAPEQVDRAEPDRRTDLYALSVVLFECLCGRPPFVGQSAASVLARALANPRPRVRERNASVPRRLAQIIERGLRLDPDDRWQDARALSDALTAFARARRLPRGADAWADIDIRNSWSEDAGVDTGQRLLSADVDPFAPTGTRRYGAASRWALVALLILVTLASAGSLLVGPSHASSETNPREDTAEQRPHPTKGAR